MKDLMKEPGCITGLRDISHHYEVFIFDLWGVVHDGISAFPSSIEVMQKLKSLGKTVLILSNSPRRIGATMDHLGSMGIKEDLYDGIYTSGEDCYDRLRLRDHPWYQQLGTTFFHIGPKGNQATFSDLGYATAQDPAKADFVLCSGTDGLCTTLDPFYDILENCLAENLPMVCANRDLCIQREGREYICVGKMAKYYQDKGGDVFYHGKPSCDMFSRLFMFNPVDIPKNKIVMIGDSLTTDIAGAQNFDIDSLFIAWGIHWNQEINDATFLHFNAFPTWVTQKCSW